MAQLITAVTERSPAAKAGVRAGMSLVAINGHPINDVLDYRFYGYDRELALELTDAQGAPLQVHLRHREGGEPGLTFETGLMDNPRTCRNRCVFCFVDQQPPGLRDSLYFKDDDARLSFLAGNYITLTNLNDADIERIIAQRISPVRVSVHASDPELRRKLLGNPRAGDCMKTLEKLAKSGIRLHTQIVVCPGLNDGENLTETLSALDGLGTAVESVAVVPVGLTRHRDGLYKLTPHTPATARDCIDRASAFERVYCADELYIKAGLPLPDDGYYGDYPQLENGVGMARMFIDDFLSCEGHSSKECEGSIATGEAFAPFLRELLEPYNRVYAVKNDFWGGGVTVAGLVTGGDLVSQLKGRELGARLLIPSSMLRHGGDLFLDGLSPADVSQMLGVPVIPVCPDGISLFKELFG